MLLSAKSLTSLSAFLFMSLHAQVGINLQNPTGAFHVNSVKETANSSTADDFVISATTGNVAIGHASPTVKLDIHTSGTAANPVPGLRILDGSQANNRIIYGDANGLATWKQLKVFTGANNNGTFSFAANTALGNTNWNSIASVTVAPGTHMVYLKVHLLQSATSGYVRTYVGTKNLGTNNNNSNDTPLLGSTDFVPLEGRDFEVTDSFVYNNTATTNVTLYFNLQSDNPNVQRSVYTSSTSFLGVNLIENYFFAIAASE